MRSREAPQDYLHRVDWGAAWTWLLCFGLVAYLGLEGGGYDPLVHDQVGIAAWWVLLATVVVGALPRRRFGKLAWVALGLFAAFTAWTALSLGWTESIDRTSADLARVGGYLGIFALVLFSRGRGEAQRVIGAVAAGIVLVSVVGLLSRLHPSWFSAATRTAGFVTDSERLSYPINYWNGLAGLIAIGLPLLLQLASGARSALTRALAAAALPAMMLTIFFTLSRGGIAAAVLALLVFVALTSDRLPKIVTLLVASAGGAILIVAVDGRDALQHGLLDETARSQGSEMLWIVLAVCLAVGLIQAGISGARFNEGRPGWTRVSRRHSLIATAAAAAVLLIAALALGAPGRVSHGWDEFKRGGGPGSGAGRLGSVAGQSRYQLWSAAVRENGAKPLTGTGSGTFEYWWLRDGDTDETVRDTHSLYLQTLGELGIVGLALIVAFLAVILAGGGRRLRAASSRARPRYAAALAGFAAFCVTAVFDWMWQIPVLAVAMLLLASVLVMPPAEAAPGEGGGGPLDPAARRRRGRGAGGDRRDRDPARLDQRPAAERIGRPRRRPGGGVVGGAHGSERAARRRRAAPAGGAGARGAGRPARCRRRRTRRDRTRVDQLAHLAGRVAGRSRARQGGRRGPRLRGGAVAEPALGAVPTLEPRFGAWDTSCHDRTRRESDELAVPNRRACRAVPRRLPGGRLRGNGDRRRQDRGDARRKPDEVGRAEGLLGRLPLRGQGRGRQDLRMHRQPGRRQDRDGDAEDRQQRRRRRSNRPPGQ